MENKTVSLALQGGGSHLAFSWGVIDYLLEDGRINFEGGSGTSAGGLTCAAIAQGFMKNGKKGARDELEAFWRMISIEGEKAGLRPSYIDEQLTSSGMEFSPVISMINTLSLLHLSPYQWNPYGLDLFRKMLNGFFDFEKLATNDKFKLFLTATNVRNSKLKIFTGAELTVDAFMASACLPKLSPAVEIDGEAYWDGGLIGNPSLFPLIYNCESADIIIVLVIPHEISYTPTSDKQISWRMKELMHITTLTREMRSIEFITSLIDSGIADKSKLKRVNVHVIEDHQYFGKMDSSSIFNTDWKFLSMLYDRGRSVAAKWLEENYENIGKRSSTNIKDTYL